MTPNDHGETIRSFIAAELVDDPSVEVGFDDELLIEGIVDSLAATRLVGFIESNWNLSIPPQDVIIENFGTINQMAAYVSRRVEGSET